MAGSNDCCSYDFFYKNGVPRWRGTGYYYSRFRPGLGVRILLNPRLTDTLTYPLDRSRVPDIPHLNPAIRLPENELYPRR